MGPMNRWIHSDILIHHENKKQQKHMQICGVYGIQATDQIGYSVST